MTFLIIMRVVLPPLPSEEALPSFFLVDEAMRIFRVTIVVDFFFVKELPAALFSYVMDYWPEWSRCSLGGELVLWTKAVLLLSKLSNNNKISQDKK